MSAAPNQHEGLRLPVLHLIGGGDTGGAMANVLTLVTALRRLGVDARLLCLGEGGLAEVARERGLPVRVLPMAHAADARVLAPLRAQLVLGAGAHSPWAVLHAHGMRANLPVRLLLPSLSRRPCLVTTVHSDLLLDYDRGGQGRLYGLLDRLTSPAVDRVVAVSGSLRSRLVERGWPAQKIAVVPSGLEGLEPDPAVDWPAGSPPWSDGRPLVGTVARLVPVKDLDLFLGAAAQLRRRGVTAGFVIVGSGPEEPRLRRRVEELDLAGEVFFAGEIRPARRLLAAFAVYLLTSRSEGLPVSVLEAMAAGLPVVATDVGGLREAVTPGRTGVLVPRAVSAEQTATLLADALAALLRDPARRARLGAAARSQVAHRFSADSIARRMIRVYERCLAERG